MTSLITALTLIDCMDGQVQLVSTGNITSEGTVLLCSDNTWGLIAADSGWDGPDAQVVCKQAGYSRGQ